MVQFIDFFQREALGLIDHEVDEANADETACEPDEEDLGLQIDVSGAVVDEIRGRIGQSPVEQPVGGRRHRQGLGSNLQRVDFSSDDPI